MNRLQIIFGYQNVDVFRETAQPMLKKGHAANHDVLDF